VGKTVIAGYFAALESGRVPLRSSGKPVRREPDAMRPALPKPPCCCRGLRWSLAALEVVGEGTNGTH